jgi:hypothetical protein
MPLYFNFETQNWENHSEAPPQSNQAVTVAPLSESMRGPRPERRSRRTISRMEAPPADPATLIQEALAANPSEEDRTRGRHRHLENPTAFPAPRDSCPLCGSEDIENFDAPHDGILEVTCNECGGEWTEPEVQAALNEGITNPNPTPANPATRSATSGRTWWLRHEDEPLEPTPEPETPRVLAPPMTQTRSIRLTCYGIDVSLTQTVFDGEAEDEPPVQDDELRGTITYDEDNLKKTCPHCSDTACMFTCEESKNSLKSWVERNMRGTNPMKKVQERVNMNGAVEGIMTLVLSHACVGINVKTPAYIEGIKRAVERAREQIRNR